MIRREKKISATTMRRETANMSSTHPASVQAGRQRREGLGSLGLTRPTLPLFFSFAQRVRQASFLLQFRGRRIKLCRPNRLGLDWPPQAGRDANMTGIKGIGLN